jgi:hypothetical protein
MNYSDLSDQQLLLNYMNLVKTYYGAHGHGKADRNEKSMEVVKNLLNIRGMPVPPTDFCLLYGIFNGEGSK